MSKAKIKTASVPDIYGNSIFCEDVRFEIDGKVTYVGVYTEAMFVKEFPVTLPKFCVVTFFNQKTKIFRPDVGVRIFVPGDNDEKASIQADMRQTPANTQVIPSLETEEKGEYTALGATFAFAPFVIGGPGLIKVRILRDGVLHRLGTLKVRDASSLPKFTPSNES